jgi:RNA polymerase sigma-70 factor (ECF subfamily)
MPGKKSKFSIYTDEELMLFIYNGETGAFDEIYFRYSGNLMNYFKKMLNYDRDLSEDALQDLFLKIAESPEKFDRSRSFKTWLYAVASNICKNIYRRWQVEKESNETILPLPAADPFLNVARRMDAVHFRRLLDEVLDGLPPLKKEAFILKYQEERSIAEIAYIQGCPEGSVKSRLHYTIKLLEEKLQVFNPLNQ